MLYTSTYRRGCKPLFMMEKLYTSIWMRGYKLVNRGDALYFYIKERM
jgi:hypothetical protein